MVRLVTLGIGLCWVVSLFLPALQPAGGKALTGWYLLGAGWRAAAAGIWAWYANPLFVGAIGLLLLRRSRAAGVVAAIALVLGMSSFAMRELAARAGYPSPPLSFGAGFHLWLVSLFSLSVWAWVAAFLDKTHRSGC